ncbi:plasmid pRiA4b ORF-3 family protein [Maledivibacter halophilus]|uniref:PRiA4b ORF-3-like protein n=1 Tax=Maledivibacter halophilus TaxID=36842 RepID=A0A1T5IML4_9FIRM|nr:plasmid pRiA4b ORF-3 family protein [Maledivibacter halophilus]SKC40416.1 pRiA4b ORF-3-like protein [Maledivibacter halophilus]
MLIQCTKKLMDILKTKTTLIKDEKPLFSWHANLISINRRNTVVLVNDSNRYTIILYGLKSKDFKKLDEIAINAIRETLLAEGIKAEIVEEFINASPKVSYAKTKNRSMVARMNKSCDNVYSSGEILDANSINQSNVSMVVSALLVGNGKNEYIYPNENMYKDLENFVSSSIFSCRALELKILLNLLNHKVWRSIIVPDYITFKQFHHILQIVFDWKDYHLHDFYVFDGDKPVVNLVCSNDAFEYPNEVPMLQESNIKLSEYLPKYSRIKYNYDFGDNWEHYITVEKTIENYMKNYPICIDGKGNAPPEDVGGELGYDEFLEAISDPKHPEHHDMVNWSKMQGYRNFDFELVNRRLKVSLKRLS